MIRDEVRQGPEGKIHMLLANYEKGRRRHSYYQRRRHRVGGTTPSRGKGAQRARGPRTSRKGKKKKSGRRTSERTPAHSVGNLTPAAQLIETLPQLITEKRITQKNTTNKRNRY